MKAKWVMDTAREWAKVFERMDWRWKERKSDRMYVPNASQIAKLIDELVNGLDTMNKGVKWNSHRIVRYSETGRIRAEPRWDEQGELSGYTVTLIADSREL